MTPKTTSNAHLRYALLRFFASSQRTLPPSHDGPIFPRLRHLRWRSKERRTAAQVLGFFSSTVKALELELPPYILHETQMVLQSLALRDLRELEELLINTREKDAAPAICTMLVECSRLKSLSLTLGSGLHPGDMRQIDRLHNLRYLYIYPGILFKDKAPFSKDFKLS